MSIDAALGRLGNKSGVCTSSTRPVNPFEGQLIYETDTNRTLVYDNAAWLVVADNQVLSIDSANSRVGIGATNPARPLEVDGGSVGIAATFKSTNATGGISLMGSGTTDDTRVRIGAEGDDLKLFSNNIERVRIDSSGNVGINDNTPSYKLDVNGDINATGNLRIQSNPINCVTALQVDSTQNNFSADNTVETKIPFTSSYVVRDTLSWFDDTNDRITPTIAGYYLVNAQAQILDSGANGYKFETYIRKSGGTPFTAANTQSAPYPTVATSGVSYANGSTDYFEVFVWQNSGSTKTFYRRNFSVVLLEPA